MAAVILTAVAVRAETIDRIAVTVAHHVITESEIVEDLRVSAFIDGKTPDFSGPAKRKAADRLVDLYLVLQDAAVTRVPVPAPGDVAALVEPVRARYASESDYDAALERAGITTAQLTMHLLEGLRMLRYTDLRFRPEVQINEDDLREAFAALLAKQPKGSPAPSYATSRDQLLELVTSQRTLEALDRWLAMTRTETQILYREAAFQ